MWTKEQERQMDEQCEFIQPYGMAAGMALLAQDVTYEQTPKWFNDLSDVQAVRVENRCLMELSGALQSEIW